MRSFRATDLDIAALATHQHGVVTRSQLLALGLSDIAISLSARSGRLHRVHRGVYAVGHLLGLAGWTVLRFTWTQVTTRRNWVAAAVRRRIECG